MPNKPNENAIGLSLAAQRLSVLLEEADQYVAKLDAEDENDDADDDDVSSSSDDSENNVCEYLEFYVGLLMNLIPSLERLYNQSLTPKEDNGLTSQLPTTVPYQDLLHDPQKPSKSRSVKHTSQDQIASDTNKSGPFDIEGSARIPHSELWARDLREKFENRMSLRTSDSRGMLHCPSIKRFVY